MSRPDCHTEDVRQHVPQLDVGILEDLLHAVALAGVFRDQLPAPAGQIPQLADREGWDEAWPDHAVTEKVRQPAAIVRIGLVPAPVLHIGGVGEDHADVRLEQVEDRLPVAPRALHHGMGAALGNQPSGKPVEFANDGAELLDLGPWFLLGAAGHHADQHELLADIDAGTPLNHCFDHRRSSLRTSSRRRSGHIVLRAQQRHQSGVRKPPAGQIVVRGQTTNKPATFLPVRKGILAAPANAGQGRPSHPQVRPLRGHLGLSWVISYTGGRTALSRRAYKAMEFSGILLRAFQGHHCFSEDLFRR